MSEKKHAPKSSGEFVDGANVPNPQGAPEDATDATLFMQGRTAALAGISKEDAPWDPKSREHKHWLNGWKSVER